MAVQMETAGVKENLFSADFAARLREIIFCGRAGRREATRAQVWQWCSRALWNRDGKDRIIVVARLELAASEIEAHGG